MLDLLISCALLFPNFHWTSSFTKKGKVNIVTLLLVSSLSLCSFISRHCMQLSFATFFRVQCLLISLFFFILNLSILDCLLLTKFFDFYSARKFQEFSLKVQRAPRFRLKLISNSYCAQLQIKTNIELTIFYTLLL